MEVPTTSCSHPPSSLRRTHNTLTTINPRHVILLNMTARRSMTSVLIVLACAFALPLVYFMYTPMTAIEMSLSALSSHRIAPTFAVDLDLVGETELLYSVGGISYFSPVHRSLATLTSKSEDRALSPNKLQPVAIIPVEGNEQGVVTVDIVRSTIDALLDEDDVLTRAWLTNIWLLTTEDTGHTIKVEPDVFTVLQRQYAVEHISLAPNLRAMSAARGSLHEELPHIETLHIPVAGLRGPYLQERRESDAPLHPVYRLYPDTYRTFLFGIYPTNDESRKYKTFRRVNEWGYNLIPVPSRLYWSRDQSDNGIKGKRIGIKDLYDINGVPTAAGSREYGELYGNRERSAKAVEALIMSGGCLVGKTKTTSFATGLDPHEGSISEQYPFSPRSDLYQSCGGSSSGSACAMAAYDWLDFAIGTDTGGSVRGPAAVAGLYGNRPSTGAVPLDGVIPLSSYADTAGVLSRDPVSFSSFIHTWYEDSPLKLQRYSKLPSTLLVADDYLNDLAPDAHKMIHEFLADVGERLFTNVEYLDLDKALAQHNYTREILRKLDEDGNEGMGWWTYEKNGQPFQEDYAKTHDGRLPPVDPSIRHWWKEGKDLGDYAEKYQAYEERMQAFADIFNDHILKQDEASCSQSILVYDIGLGGRPLYRETALNAPRAHDTAETAIQGKEFAALAGCPDYTVPIGQVTFDSPISGMKEFQAVSVSLVARRGCDFVLANFVKRLFQDGVISAVKTGRTAF